MIDYKCKFCGLAGHKLWRDYNTFVEYNELKCAKCAMERAGKEGIIDKDGFRDGGLDMRTDQIGWFVPAVLTPDGDSFWGYTSAPPEAVDKWRALPTY